MMFPNDQPRVEATIRADGSAEVVLAGVAQSLQSPTVEQARADMVGYVAHRAQAFGHPLRVEVDDPDGHIILTINPDGSLGESSAVPNLADTIPPGGLDAAISQEADVAAGAVEGSGAGGPVPPSLDPVSSWGPPSTPSPIPVDPGDPATDETRVMQVSPLPAHPGAADGDASWAGADQTIAMAQHQAPGEQGQVPAGPQRWPDAGPEPTPSWVGGPAPQAGVPGGPTPAGPPLGPVAPGIGEGGPMPSGMGPVPPAGPQPQQWQPQGPAASQPQPPGVPQQDGPVSYQGGPGWDPQAPQGGPVASPMTRRQARESFLHAEQPEAPASRGVRGALARIGIRTQPSADERAEREDIHAVSQHWPGVRTIAVVNGKGGANKTPTTALLAATFARYSGAATIAWDNNETRGTLGWRTEQGKHDATVLDLIPEVERLLDPSARAGDISHYVHHQPADKYDVLRSNPNLLSSEQRISGTDVDRLHDVLGRYYRLVFVDSGNDESADHWLQMIDKADQVVVPTIAKPEHAEAGALLLEALTTRGGRAADLARRAVVVVSQAREKDSNPSAAQIAEGFAAWTSASVTIPYDRAMVENVLRFDALAPATRRAWLRAAAAVARQL